MIQYLISILFVMIQLKTTFSLYLYIIFVSFETSTNEPANKSSFTILGSDVINTEQAGLTAADVEIADWLRKVYSNKCTILAVNKCESPRKGTMQAAEFWSLG